MTGEMVKLSIQVFEEIVADALDELPARFHSALVNVAVVVEEEPDPARLDVEIDPDSELLGLYVGTPMTERSASHPEPLPDRVYIFRGPVLRMCDSAAEVRHEIRDTVIHELGHHIGLSDDEMPY